MFVDAKGDQSGRAPAPSDSDAPPVYVPQSAAGTDAPHFELVEDEDVLPF